MQVIYKREDEFGKARYFPYASAREISRETGIPYTTLLSWRSKLRHFKVQNVVFLSMLDVSRERERKDVG